MASPPKASNAAVAASAGKEKERTMEFLINGSLVTSKTREAFLERLEIDRRSSETWELIRKGIIKVHGFKIGGGCVKGVDM